MDSEKRKYRNVAIAAGLAVSFAGGVAADKTIFASPTGEHNPTPSPTLKLPEPSKYPVIPLKTANPGQSLELTFPPTMTPSQEEPTQTSEAVVREGTINLGTETDLSLANLGIKYTPDGHIPYITLSNGQKRYFTVSSRNEGATVISSTYVIATPGESLQDSIEQNLLQNPKNVREVLGPAQNPDYNYSGITSVFQLDSTNENHLTAILHQEQWASPGDGSNFTASVGAFESFDAGLTWQNGRTILTGDDSKAPGEVVSGAGQPNAIQVGDYLYIYHIDWSAKDIIQHPDQIYLARVKVENGTIDNSVEYYTENGFSTVSTAMKSVIPVPGNIDNAGYAALPSISWNTYLNQYLCVFETNVGFAQATSEDGLNWSEPQLIFPFPQAQSDRNVNELWNSYPTLVSDDTQPNDNVTDQNGRLYFSQGNWMATSHNMVAEPFEIK